MLAHFKHLDLSIGHLVYQPMLVGDMPRPIVRIIARQRLRVSYAFISVAINIFDKIADFFSKLSGHFESTTSNRPKICR
jgi:hypothetical protein